MIVLCKLELEGSKVIYSKKNIRALDRRSVVQYGVDVLGVKRNLFGWRSCFEMLAQLNTYYDCIYEDNNI